MRGCPLHVRHRSDENVNDAMVVALAGDGAKLVIHQVRVFTNQIIRVMDADLLKSTADGFANVGYVGEGLDVISVHGEVIMFFV